MVQSQYSFDKASNPGGGLQVADVAFDRTNGARFLAGIQISKKRGQGRKFNHVANWRTGTMRFEVREILGCHLGHIPRFSDDFNLAQAAGGHKAKLARPVIVDS